MVDPKRTVTVELVNPSRPSVGADPLAFENSVMPFSLYTQMSDPRSMSGTRADRPQLAPALEFAREGDVLVVARLDRLARSMRQLLSTADTLQARGIGLRSLLENIDTTSASGRLILRIFAALGQFEVELLRERTRTALAASRARGRVGGRPPALDAMKVTAAKAMLASGTMTGSEVARQIGCSASTLYRHVPGGRTAVAESGMPAAI